MSRQVFNQETQVWDVINEDLPVTPQSTEELSNNARSERNSLLSATDWAAGSDLEMSDGMKVYRQGLRDVPSQGGFPQVIDWPIKP